MPAAHLDDLAGDSDFRVHLDVFEGPFDLLLSLIAKRRLDVTSVALSQVTDEFISFIRSHGDDWDLDTASGFLVVAATLLDLKVARLLPDADLADDEDLALLEARDLLLARLLQYRAYKQVAATFADWVADTDRRFGRSVSLEPQFAELLPDVVLGVDPYQLAAIAARAGMDRPPAVIDISHVHAPVVSVREQAVLLAARLRTNGTATFRSLIADCAATAMVVARFLGVLELYRESAVTFDQVEPLGELFVHWVGTEVVDLAADLDQEYDVEQDAVTGNV